MVIKERPCRTSLEHQSANGNKEATFVARLIQNLKVKYGGTDYVARLIQNLKVTFVVG
jgi:hypothetical protein